VPLLGLSATVYPDRKILPYLMCVVDTFTDEC